MTAVDVDDQNFRCWLPRIAESIEGAAFVSFDLEFLGLPSALKNHSASLFDSPSDRYRKVRDAVRRFPPCQLGLVCFQEDGDAARYRPDVYCITLFKRVPQREFSVSPSAVCFLSKHDFDFNKGVNYCTKTEAAKLRSEVSFGEFDFRQLREDFADLVRSVRIQIAAESEGDVGVSQLLDGPFQLKGPVEVELFRSQDNAEGDTVPRCLSPLEEAALHYVLQEEFPDLEFRTDPSRTLLCVENRQPVLDNDSILPTQQKLEMLIAEISGVSRIFDLLSAQKVPIVAHNCLLDLMYIYNYFDDDLPENYPLWKEKFHERFPAVIDSKFFAETLGENSRSFTQALHTGFGSTSPVVVPADGNISSS